MTDTTLFCLVHGDNPTRHAFSVKIPKTTTVDALKEHIKAKKANDLKDIDADKLTLWKVSIAADELAILDPHFDFKTLGMELAPLSKISKVFPDEPEDEHLHIVIEAPPVYKKITITTVYERKDYQFLWSVERHKATIALLQGEVYNTVKFPEGVLEEDILLRAAFDATSQHTLLQDDKDLLHFIGMDNDPQTISLIINTKQLPYSFYSFNNMKRLFGIESDSYTELPLFEADVADIAPNILESVIDELLRRYRGCFHITDANEATRKHFIGCVLWGVIEHYDRILRIVVEHEISGAHGKGPVDFAIKHADRGVIVGITEAKRNNLNNGVGQNAVQLQSSLQHNKRKRDHDEMSNDMSLYGVVTTADNWVVTKVVMAENGKTEVFISNLQTSYLPLADKNLTREKLREPLSTIMGQIKWVFDQQIEPRNKRQRRVSPRLAEQRK